MWARIVAWAAKAGTRVYRWVLANKGLILTWIARGIAFLEICAEILKRV